MLAVLLANAGAGLGHDVCNSSHPKPVYVVQALLDAYLDEHIDDDSNLYFYGSYYYFPTIYVSKNKFSGPQEAAGQLLKLLKCANRDVYYRMFDSP